MNLISSTRTAIGQIEIIEQQELITLEEAEVTFKKEFKKAMDAESGVFLFKVPTGLGKTFALETLENVTIALPTHALKTEVSGRMKVDHLCSPSLPEFSPDIKAKLQFFYATGLFKKALSLIKATVDCNDKHDAALAVQYLDETNATYKANETVLTTHQKAIFANFKHDTLIFDEDPFSSIMPIHKVTIGDFISLSNVSGIEDTMKAVTSFLQHDLTVGVYTKLPLFSFDYNKLVDSIANSNLNHNILDFFNSVYIIKDINDPNIIHYVIKRDLPKVKKLIIMSATASEFIFSKLFTEELVIIDLMHTEQVGKVIQNTKHSYSKTSFNKRTKHIVEEVGDLPVITFAKLKNLFNNPVQNMHFGNLSGYDDLKGQDIAVVGTFHLNEYVYFMYALALGIELKNRDNQTTHQMIEWNGFKFKFNTYDNLDLREIQLSLIEAELIQAVGRSRGLREDVTVYLYSNLPLKQTTKFIK